MKNVIDRLVRYNVSCAKAFELDAGLILARTQPRDSADSYAHENYRYAAAVFLALYLTPHPANPYHGNPEALALYQKLADRWVTRWEEAEADGEAVDFSEWPPHMIARGLDRVGRELPPALRRRWQKFLAWYAGQSIPGPFFFTAPNHEAWKLAVLALAARVLRRSDWRRAAEFKMRQLIRYQTAEGFWEEGRHHGPSMKYNSLMLGAMTLVARETRSRPIAESAARLASFMARWAFPDGVTVGAFDGRQSTSPGYFGVLVPGLDLSPAGAVHLERILDFWEKAGWLDEPRAVGPSNWYAHFGFPFAAESLLYYARAETAARKSPALPMDRKTARIENHTPAFDGVLLRRGPWCVAVSGQISDVPKDTQFRYRLERQNRIEIWHERASVVIGGGHSLVTCAYPLFNVWIDPGYGKKPDLGSYAHTDGAASGPDAALRRSRYYPRAALSGTTGCRAWLELVFAHATVRFDVRPLDGNTLDIRYSYQSLPVAGVVREIRLALPMVLWQTARAFADDTHLPSKSRLLTLHPRHHLVVETPLFQTRAVLTFPASGTTEVRWPLEPVRTYGELFSREKFESFFRMAQVETVLRNPPPRGTGRWLLTIASLR